MSSMMMVVVVVMMKIDSGITFTSWGFILAMQRGGFLDGIIYIGIAIHLNTSKVQYLGKKCVQNLPRMHAAGMFESFPLFHIPLAWLENLE
jgi:hypothetical protein